MQATSQVIGVFRGGSSGSVEPPKFFKKNNFEIIFGARGIINFIHFLTASAGKLCLLLLECLLGDSVVGGVAWLMASRSSKRKCSAGAPSIRKYFHVSLVQVSS